MENSNYESNLKEVEVLGLSPRSSNKIEKILSKGI